MAVVEVVTVEMVMVEVPGMVTVGAAPVREIVVTPASMTSLLTGSPLLLASLMLLDEGDRRWAVTAALQ